jgi:hypothetical protein
MLKRRRIWVLLASAAGTCAAAAILMLLQSAGANQDATIASGSFRQGWDLMHRRAGFSGRPLLMVFANAEHGLDQVQREVFADERIQEAAARFSAALVNPDEIPAEADFRPPEADLPIVHARDVHGRCLGILTGAEVTAANVRDLLGRLSEVPLSAWPRSPLYESLLESAGALDAMIARGEFDEAKFVIDMLAELEPASEAAARAEERRSRLPR